MQKSTRTRRCKLDTRQLFAEFGRSLKNEYYRTYLVNQRVFKGLGKDKLPKEMVRIKAVRDYGCDTVTKKISCDDLLF